MKTRLFALLTLLTMASATSTLAASEDLLEDLVGARRRVVSAAQHTKGLPRANLDVERLRLNRLIAELESGQSVDPMRIDDEIQRAMRLYR